MQWPGLPEESIHIRSDVGRIFFRRSMGLDLAATFVKIRQNRYYAWGQEPEPLNRNRTVSRAQRVRVFCSSSLRDRVHATSNTAQRHCGPSAVNARKDDPVTRL